MGDPRGHPHHVERHVGQERGQLVAGGVATGHEDLLDACGVQLIAGAPPVPDAAAEGHDLVAGVVDGDDGVVAQRALVPHGVPPSHASPRGRP